MKPLVSILIPAFNAEEWIAETLRSAIGQTWDRTEIIVVDDGSTDHTVEIARQFESSSVRVVTQKHKGPCEARNRALSLSRGDYVQWLDADDLLHPDKLSLQLEVAARSPSKRLLISSEWGQFQYRSERAIFVPTALWNDLSPAEWLLRKLDHCLHMQTATWLVSRELTEAAGPWDPEQIRDNDGEYFCRVILASDGISFVRGARVYYRASGSHGVSYIGRSHAKIDALWRSMQIHIRALRSLDDSERARTACLRYLQAWLLYFYPERREILVQVEELARDLGGQLEPPSLSWKYTWIRSLFGWQVAKRANLSLPMVRWCVTGAWDKAMHRIGSERLGLKPATACLLAEAARAGIAIASLLLGNDDLLL